MEMWIGFSRASSVLFLIFALDAASVARAMPAGGSPAAAEPSQTPVEIGRQPLLPAQFSPTDRWYPKVPPSQPRVPANKDLSRRWLPQNQGRYAPLPPVHPLPRQHVDWCDMHYRSYDRRTDTYTTYDGSVRRCQSRFR